MSCPYCSKYNIRLAGKYYVRRLRNREQRLYCKDCKKSFVRRNTNFRKKISFVVKEKIIRLYSEEKGFVKKYDPFKKTTYSMREIAKMLNVSDSFVAETLKR